jgi:hypothetical protein
MKPKMGCMWDKVVHAWLMRFLSSCVALALAFASSIVVTGCAEDADDIAPASPAAGEEPVGAEDEVVTSRLAKFYASDEENARLDLTATGGRLGLGCSTGELSSRLRLDAQGRFAVDGTYRRRSPGGMRPTPGRPLASEPIAVRYTGKVSGNEMTLRFTVDGNRHEYHLNANEQMILSVCK